MATAHRQIPLDSELSVHAVWYIRLRWWAVIGMLAGTWLIGPLAGLLLPRLELTVIALVVLAANIGFLSWTRRTGAAGADAQRLHRRQLYAQLAIDWCALILLVFYTGGVRSPLALAFAFHLMLAALLMSRAMCYWLTLIVIGILAAFAGLEQSGYWPEMPLRVPYLATDSAAAGVWLLALVLLFGCVSLMGTTIASRLRVRECELADSESRLDAANSQLHALYELGQMVNATLDMKQVLALLAEHGAELLGMRASAIRILNREENRLELAGTYGLSEAYLNKGPVPLVEGSSDMETLAGKVVVIDDMRTDPRVLYPIQARDEGLHAVLCVPLKAGNEALGILRLYAAAAHQFTPEEQAMARNLANLGAVAIGSARDYADLQKVGAQRDWFARTTHHELRAPLAAVRSMLDALLLMDPSPRQASFIERARSRVDQMLDLIRDLLDLAGASQQDLQGAAPACLQTVAQACLEQAQERALNKQVRFQVDLPAQNIYLSLSAEFLGRVVGNLLDNAVKYSPAKSTVAISATSEAGGLRLEVADQGIGIQACDQERIFGGFYRTQKARESGESGTGLGLAIVQHLVTRSGGTISVSSVPGEGACFTVEWPERSLVPGDQPQQEKTDHA